MKFRASLIFVFLFASCGFRQRFKKDTSQITNWKSHKITKKPNDLWVYNKKEMVYEAPKIEYCVFMENNEVRVKPFSTKATDSTLKALLNINKDGRTYLSYIKGEDGYLVGLNHGEFGGEIRWYSNEGKIIKSKKGFKISQFIKRDSEIYAIHGLNHMMLSYGSIIKVRYSNKEYFPEEYLKLPNAPHAITLDNDNNFLVIISTSILKIKPDKTIQIILNNCFLDNGLYANSIVFANNIIYAGMPGGVFKYNLLTKKQEWLLPD